MKSDGIATVTARCRECGDTLDHAAEYVGGVCLCCQLGSAPLARTTCRYCEIGEHWRCTCIDADGEPVYASYLTGSDGSYA